MAGALAAFESIEWFPKTGEIRLLKRGAGEVSVGRGAPVPDTCIERQWIRTSESMMEIEFDCGEVVELDLPARPPVPDPRPVVYLDQNHWIELARARVGSPRLSGDRLKVYERFTDLAECEAIIVPLSSAHLVELTRKSGQQRRDVAVTMLRLSRGWQMRSPLAVRDEELKALFNGARSVGAPVFTLEPEVCQPRTRPPQPFASPGDVDAELTALVADLSWATTLADVLAKDERIESPAGVDMAERWAASFGELAQHVRTNQKAKVRLRDVTRMRFISDLQADLVSAANMGGMSPQAFGDWLMNDAEAALLQLPSLGRIREVTHRRLANADDQWDRNDLVDLLFLCTAAGYADFVLAERKIGNYLRRIAPGVPLGGQVFVKMIDALQAIEAQLAQLST